MAGTELENSPYFPEISGIEAKLKRGYRIVKGYQKIDYPESGTRQIPLSETGIKRLEFRRSLLLSFAIAEPIPNEVYLGVAEKDRDLVPLWMYRQGLAPVIRNEYPYGLVSNAPRLIERNKAWWD
jgi:hypothetical protein